MINSSRMLLECYHEDQNHVRYYKIVKKSIYGDQIIDKLVDPDLTYLVDNIEHKLNNYKIINKHE